MKQGDTVLVWGASGGLGSYATQYALNGGAIPVCVVSSPEKEAIVRSMGAELVIDRSAEGYRFWKDEHTRTRRSGSGSASGSASSPAATTSTSSSSTRVGRPSAPASTSPSKGGTITTCASTSGYMHPYDNRYLWMNLKRIVGSHFANYRESWEANRLIAKGRVHPTLSRTLPAGGDRAGRLRRPPQPAPGQGRRALPRAHAEGLGVRDPDTAWRATSTRSTGSAGSEATAPPAPDAEGEAL